MIRFLKIVAFFCLQPVFSFSQAMMAELFFDTDPGIGNGISLNLAEGNMIDEVINQSASNFPTGEHRIYMRLKDGNRWSHYFSLGKIRIIASENKPVSGGEYFLNQDPGQGNGIATPFQANEFPDVLLNLEASAFQPGRNYFYYRLTDGSNWSHYHMLSFNVSRNASNSGNIQFIDYFAENSGAPVNWTRIPVSPGSEIDHPLVIPLNDIALGEQIAFIRLVDDQNNYSHYHPVNYSVCEIDEPRVELNNDTLISSLTSNAYQWFFNGDSIPGANDPYLIATQEGRYAVRTGSGVCTSLSLPFFYLSTGISMIQTTSPVLYPNPANNFLHLTINHGAVWEILDASGRLIRKGQNNENAFDINISDLTRGMYLIRLRNQNGIYITRFLVGRP